MEGNLFLSENDIIILNYKFDSYSNKFHLSDSDSEFKKDLPKYFVVMKNLYAPKIKAKYLFIGRTMDDTSCFTGVRVLRKDILYGDKLSHNKKSFLIIRYLDNNNIELHYFDGFCPRNKFERSAFLTFYFEDAKIAGDDFKTAFKSWKYNSQGEQFKNS